MGETLAKRILKTVIGLVIGLGLLWLLFRNTNWAEVGAALRDVRAGWLLVAEAVVLATFFTRILRWRYIVRTAGPVSFRHMFSATQIGFLANFSLPVRMGEFIRALALGRLARLPFSKCVAMTALDRVLDLIGLAALIVIALAAYRPSGEIVIPAETFGRDIHFAADYVLWAELVMVVGLIATVSALVVLYVKQDLMLQMSDRCVGVVSGRLAARVHTILRDFAEGLHIFRSASDMAKSVFFSLVTWALFCLIAQAALAAFGIKGPWYTVFVLQVFVAVCVSVPGAPGFVGQFHVPIVVALVMVIDGMDPSRAKAVAIVTHLVNLIPVYVVGVFCLFWEKMGLAELSRESARAEQELQAAPSSDG